MLKLPAPGVVIAGAADAGGRFQKWRLFTGAGGGFPASMAGEATPTMKPHASAPAPPGRAPPRRRARRRPVFPLTREQVRARCAQLGLDPLCAGEVLALMDLMELRGCCILGLHEGAGVARSMISGILKLTKFPTTPVRLRLLRALKANVVEFEAMAVFSMME